MIKLISIHKLAAHMGLTSRTLRHWEDEGLFKSGRDKDSGWRVYDKDNVLRVKITALLRSIDVPIGDIKPVLNEKSLVKLREVVEKRLAFAKEQKRECRSNENRLKKVLSFLQEQSYREISDESLSQLSEFIKTVSVSDEKEELLMTELKFITLPPMRAVGNMAVGVSPEDDAMNPVIEWIESAGLSGTARLFGGNMPPMPSGEGKPYGYGMCATVPEDVDIPEHLSEMRLPGGVFAMIESTDDIPASWKKLMKLLSVHDKYKADHSSKRLCLEEHIRKDGEGFFLNLLEPVKEK